MKSVTRVLTEAIAAVTRKARRSGGRWPKATGQRPPSPWRALLAPPRRALASGVPGDAVLPHCCATCGEKQCFS